MSARPGEDIVLVITASSHRHDAFAAAEFLMDYLKTSAPFWILGGPGKDAGAAYAYEGHVGSRLVRAVVDEAQHAQRVPDAAGVARAGPADRRSRRSTPRCRSGL